MEIQSERSLDTAVSDSIQQLYFTCQKMSAKSLQKRKNNDANNKFLMCRDNEILSEELYLLYFNSSH